MTATYAGSSDTEQKTDYIRVVPDANFTANATSGRAPLAVGFTDASNGTPTAWSWEFGDGATATVQSPSHVYTAVGQLHGEPDGQERLRRRPRSRRLGFVRVEPSRPSDGPRVATASRATSTATGCTRT